MGQLNPKKVRRDNLSRKCTLNFIKDRNLLLAPFAFKYIEWWIFFSASVKKNQRMFPS